MAVYIITEETEYTEENTENQNEILEDQGEENEITQGSEYQPQYNIQTVENSPSCTYVFAEDGKIVCLENVLNIQPSSDAAGVNEGGETAEETSASSEEVKKSSDTKSEIKTDNELLTSINTLIGEYIESDDTYKQNLSSDISDISLYLSDIYQHINVFLGIYLIGWIFSQTNSWRRNNKS